jgi:hypothetical protein
MNFRYLKTTMSLLAMFFIISCGNDNEIDTDGTGEEGSGEIEFTGLSYEIVDTGVSDFYSNYSIISTPGVVDAFYGQDAT